MLCSMPPHGFKMEVSDDRLRRATINDRTSVYEAQTSGPGAHVLLNAMFGPTTIMNFTVHNAGVCMVVDTYGV
jgi:hypothetical protein